MAQLQCRHPLPAHCTPRPCTCRAHSAWHLHRSFAAAATATSAGLLPRPAATSRLLTQSTSPVSRMRKGHVVPRIQVDQATVGRIDVVDPREPWVYLARPDLHGVEQGGQVATDNFGALRPRAWFRWFPPAPQRTDEYRRSVDRTSASPSPSGYRLSINGRSFTCCLNSVQMRV